MLKLWSLKISVHAGDVKAVLRVFSIEVPVHEKTDLDEEAIVKRLRKVRFGFSTFCVRMILSFAMQAGGASYDGV